MSIIGAYQFTQYLFENGVGHPNKSVKMIQVFNLSLLFDTEWYNNKKKIINKISRTNVSGLHTEKESLKKVMVILHAFLVFLM